MGRIVGADGKGAMVKFDSKEITIKPRKGSKSIKLEIEIHLDGDMMNCQSIIDIRWKYAPEEMRVFSLDEVEIPVNRTGGRILIPSRVVGFDPRRVKISTSWNSSQIEKMTPEDTTFGISIVYENTDTQTVLINSGRGLKDAKRERAMFAAGSTTIANITYLPMDVIGKMVETSVRRFDDNSIHIDCIEGNELIVPEKVIEAYKSWKDKKTKWSDYSKASGGVKKAKEYQKIIENEK